MTDKPDPMPGAPLPEGYDLEQDQDGDWVLTPPKDVTIFSEPGEGWLVIDDYMEGRDWDSREDVLAACCAMLNKDTNHDR